jgi:predicted HicB family RNase H-like nuclease
VSLYTNMNNASDVKCPTCNDNRNLHSMPISSEIESLTYYSKNLYTLHQLDSIEEKLEQQQQQFLSESSKKSSSNRSKKSDTESITFRINKNVLDKIRSETSRHNVSLNSFVNRFLREFTEWDMFMPYSSFYNIAIVYR